MDEKLKTTTLREFEKMLPKEVVKQAKEEAKVMIEQIVEKQVLELLLDSYGGELPQEETIDYGPIPSGGYYFAIHAKGHIKTLRRYSSPYGVYEAGWLPLIDQIENNEEITNNA